MVRGCLPVLLRLARLSLGSILAIVVLFFGVSFAAAEVEMEIACQPPKFIPDVDKAPTVYYSIDSKQCDKVNGLLIV